MKRRYFLLFSMAALFYAPQFRDMQDDWGIIPMPKYDETQQNYYSPGFPNCYPITVVPASNDAPDDTGILLEEMSYIGYTKLLPALYDTVLSGKCARDEDSVEMLDIIFGNTLYDIGMIYDFGGIRTTIRTIYTQLDGNFASAFAEIESKADANVEDLIEAIRLLES